MKKSTKKTTKVYTARLNKLRSILFSSRKPRGVDVSSVLDWLEKKRKTDRSSIKLTPISKLTNWGYFRKEGIVRHNKGADHFFSLQGVVVHDAPGAEVMNWDQPIMVQKEGGYLVILCQEREGTVKFLLQAKFEAGNVRGFQLAPTIQATMSNLKQHHGGRKPLLSEYLSDPKTTVIYSAKHNEEGARFWQKSNINSLVLIKSNDKLPVENDSRFIWLTLAEIKALMLYDNVVNPFVKTILSPL